MCGGGGGGKLYNNIKSDRKSFLHVYIQNAYQVLLLFYFIETILLVFLLQPLKDDEVELIIDSRLSTWHTRTPIVYTFEVVDDGNRIVIVALAIDFSLFYIMSTLFDCKIFAMITATMVLIIVVVVVVSQ